MPSLRRARALSAAALALLLAAPAAASAQAPLQLQPQLPAQQPLAAPSLPTASGQAELGDVSRGAAARQPVQMQSTLPPALRHVGAASLLGGVTVSLAADAPLRAGADGVLTVHVPAQTRRPLRLRDVRLTVRVPRGFTAGRAAGDRWRCARTGARRVACTLRGGAVASGAVPAARIALHARTAKRTRRGRVTATVAWRQHLGARRRYRATARLAVAARPPLAVTARAERRRVLEPADGHGTRPLLLHGRLAGASSARPATFRWVQRCGTGRRERACRPAERVRWRTPVTGSATTPTVTARLDVPRVDRAARLRFRLIGRDWRGAGRSRLVTVTVHPTGTPRLDPDLDELRAAEVRHREPAARRPAHLGGHVVRALEVTGSALAGPRPGERAEMRLDAGEQTIADVRWHVVEGPRTLLRGRSATAARLRFRVPAGRTRLVLGVRAVVHGEPVRREVTVHVAGVRRATARARAAAATQGATPAAAPRARQAAPAAPADPARLCAALDALAQQPTLTLDGGAQLDLTGADPAAVDCRADGAALAFTSAVLTAGGQRFEDVTGTLDVAGLHLESAAWVRPDGWVSAVPGVPERVPVSAGRIAWGAPYAATGLGPLTGTVALAASLAIVPLPDGWAFDPEQSTLTFSRGSAGTSVDVHVEAAAPQPEPGRVTFDGALAPGGAITLTATATQLAVLEGSGTDTATLSGQGTLTIAKGADGKRQVTGSVALHTDGTAVLSDHLTAKDVVGTWDADGITLGGTVEVGTDDGATFTAGVAGRYVSRSEWSLAVTQQGSFALGDGVALSGARGSIARAPSADGGDTFAVTVTGTVTGWSPSPALQVRTLTGTLTNACSPGDDACTTGEVRALLELDGTLTVPTLADPIAWSGSASVNLSNRTIDLDAETTIGAFGPSELRMGEVEVHLTTPGAQQCTPRDGADAPTSDAAAPPPAATLKADQHLTVGITGDGTVLGRPFTAAGEFTTGGGYCLAAQLTRVSLTGDDQPLLDTATMVFASHDANVRIGDGVVPVDAGQLRLLGAFSVPASRLPASVRDTFAGTGAFDATISLGGAGGFGVAGQVTYTFAQPKYLVGSAADPTATRLSLTGAQLSVDAGPATGLRLGLAAKAALETPASPDGTVAASRTPLSVQATLALDPDPRLILDAGVDGAAGPVQNAFGQPGLTVNALRLSGTIAELPELGIAAGATLPQAWTSSLGISGSVRTTLALGISATQPCLELAVDARDPAIVDPLAQPPALRLGPIGASYARVLIAPRGCTIGSGDSATTVPAGFALAFTGTIGPAPVDTAFALTRKPSGRFAVKGNVDVGAFALGSAIAFDRTHLALDLDPEAGRYQVGFDGGARIGSSIVRLSGSLDASPGRFRGRLDGTGALVLGDTRFASANVHADVDASTGSAGGWALNALNVDADVQVMGATASLAFAYADGTVSSAAGALQVSGTVGPARLGAGGLVAYRPGGLKLTGNGCRVSGPGAAAITPADGGTTVVLRLCAQLALSDFNRSWQQDIGLPSTLPIDLDVPRRDVSFAIVSGYLQGALHARLTISTSAAPQFWVDSGNALAGACIDYWIGKSCVDAVNLTFNPQSGRFEGTVLGFSVAWGTDDWRRPADAGDAQSVDVRTLMSGPGGSLNGAARWYGGGFVPSDLGATRTWQVTYAPGAGQVQLAVTEQDSSGARTVTQAFLDGVPFAGRAPAPQLQYQTVRVARTRVGADGKVVWRADSPELDVAAVTGAPGTFALAGHTLTWDVQDVLVQHLSDPRVGAFVDAVRADARPLPTGLQLVFDPRRPPVTQPQ